MSRKSAIDTHDNSDIDLTPMLDVVFIMLIFFIVTASFVKESVIDARLPNHTQITEPGNAPTIVVEVRANNEIWMEQRRVDVRAVRANMERLHAENPQSPVVVRAHTKSATKTYVAIADAARAAQIANVVLSPYRDTI